MTEQQAKRRSPLVLVLLLILGVVVAGYVYWSNQAPGPVEATASNVEVVEGAAENAPEAALAQQNGAEAAPEESAVAEIEAGEAQPIDAEAEADAQDAAPASEMAQAPAEPAPLAEVAVAVDPQEETAGAAEPAQPEVAAQEAGPDAPIAVETPPAEPVESAVAEEVSAPAPEVIASIGTAAPRFGTGQAPVVPQGAASPDIAASSAPALATLPQAEIPPAANDNNDDQISGSASDGTVPRFDVVRIDANGGIVVAGRAAPDSTVTVRLGGAMIAEARADGNGQFVAIINAPASEAPQALQLESALPEQASVAGAEEFIVLPAPANATDATPALVRSSPETVELVQPFVGEVDAVSLDTISYSTVGAVVLNGRAQPGTAIRAYANDALIGETVVGETGQWRLDVPGLDAGVYRLRIDEIDASGAVTSRVESPFQRETPEAAAAQALAAQAGGQVIVQPGNTLWLMASQAYGEGLLYTQIFAANSDSIRDPDLIYPGQVFAIPVLP